MSSLSDQRSLFFTQQPILDGKRSIWGYELLGGEIREGIYEVFPQRESAAGLSSSAYWSLQDAMERGKKIMVGLDEVSVLNGVPHALPPSSGVVRVLPAEVFSPELPSVLRSLREEGYLTVLDAASMGFVSDEVREQTDIVAFDLGAESPDPERLEVSRATSSRLLARGIKTNDQFRVLRDQGFTLFQGAFFKEPEYVRDRQLNSNEISRINLMRLWEVEDPDLQEVARAIGCDVAISFRLLTYLNSAHFGLRYNVQSIDQAIMLLGWDQLKGWLRALILVDMAGKEEGPRELAGLSLQRGKFFELVAAEYDYWGFKSGTLFLLGLFSLLDAILALPMTTVVDMLPIDARIKSALCRDPSNEYWPLFQLLECLEDADWRALEILTQRLCVDQDTIKAFFARARDWAGGFYASRG